MRFLSLKGKPVNVPTQRYLIDWDGKSLSQFQRGVKQFLRRYWDKPGMVVYEEFRVAGTRMHLDFYNGTKRIAVECDGRQHTQYNAHYHKRSFSVYQMQLERDDSKEKWCEMNGITLIRIHEDEANDLSAEWLRKTYDITL